MNEIRVAVLEDDDTTAKIYEEYLHRIPGVRCVAVLHGKEEAARFIVGRRHLAGAAGPMAGSALSLDLGVDLLLVDMNLPDGHGLEVLRALRATGWMGGAIALTAAGERSVVRGALASGIVDYLLKPFTFDDFAARIVRFRDMDRSLGGAGPVPGQEDLDRLFGTSTSAHSLDLPKGLVAETLVQVREALDAATTALSARETAEATGLSRVTARRYLEHLVDTGQATRHSRHGTQGRPEVEYTRSA